jgi:hypothetical protein
MKQTEMEFVSSFQRRRVRDKGRWRLIFICRETYSHFFRSIASQEKADDETTCSEADPYFVSNMFNP